MTKITMTTTRGGCPSPTTATPAKEDTLHHLPLAAPTTTTPTTLHHLPLALLHDSILTLLCNIDELFACRAVSSILLEAVSTNPCTQLMIKGRRAGVDRGDVSGRLPAVIASGPRCVQVAACAPPAVVASGPRCVQVARAVCKLSPAQRPL